MIWLMLVTAGKALLRLLRTVPWQVWAGLALLAAIFLYGEARHRAGVQEKQAEWDKAAERGRSAVAELKRKANTVTTVVETKVVERIKTVQVKGDTREKVVTEFVPIDSGYFDGRFRVYHDAAASNTVPDPTEVANAAPVTATEVARTINVNYTRCHKAYEVVAGWQEWAKKQCALNKNGCPDGE